ncbi:MAG: Ig-like domain-containing protein [Verrucomicrobiota bacterium]
MRSCLIPAAFGLFTLPLAAQVSFTGNYTQNFDAMGTGTAPPAGWSNMGNLGGSNSSWVTSIPTSGAPSAATAGTENNTLVVNSAVAGSGSSNTQAYNFALAASSTDRCLGTSPTTGAGNVLQLRLTNGTAAALSGIRIGYDIRRFNAPAANDLPGYWLFYSIDGGVTWANVSELNPTLANVPSTAGVTTIPLTTVTFPSSVAIGGEVRLRWIDDNANQSSPDQIVGLDNLTILSSVVNALPTVSLAAPGEGATYDAPAAIHLAANAGDTDGSIAKVEFFNGATKLGEDTTEPYELAWNNVVTGSYALTAVATDNLLGTAASTPVNITVTNADNISPSVVLTAPANNATILTNSVALTADAADTDGVVSKVEFYNGATKLGEDTSSPFTFNWSGVATGTYTLTAVATDNDTATTTSSEVNVSVAVPITNTLLARRPSGQPGQVWKYLDNGSDQGNAWKETAFDDSSWASGAAPLGYTDGHIVTTVNSPASPNRHITTYFRRNFEVTGAAAVQALNLNILRDDGVVVYINGTEVARQNMPTGPITYQTFTSSIVDGANETTYFASAAAPMPVLVEGANTIAVELHQRDGASSDLGFDLELISLTPPGSPPTIALTAPLESAVFTAPATVSITADADDSDGNVMKVEFFNGATKLGEDTTEPYEFDWTMVVEGSYSLTAKATDNYGQSTTSAAVAINVGPPDTLAPVVAITAPANESNFIAPAAISIIAAANDSDGNVVKVEFFNGATKLGEDTSEPYTFDWSGVAVGDYTLTAKATDNLTATTVSAAVTVQVLPNLPPVIAPISPADLAGVNAPSATLDVSLDDPEDQPLTVTFYGRPKTAPPAADFTLVTIPDTQYYSENNNNRLSQFTSQTNWIVSQKDALNIAFVAHMGDMVNTATVEQEWVNADGAMDILENPATTLLTHGIPWGGAPGNHDVQSGGNVKWNQYFGTSRWAGRPYFKGNYSTNNDNNYQFFSAGGMDFIIINLVYNSNTAGNQGVMDWADALLKAHPTRRAIVTSHWLVNTSFPPTDATWGGHGQAVYDNLKDNPNLFMMLCGHIHGEGRRDDVFEGRTVNTILQDYQSRSGAPGGLGGGDGWLRYYVFSPANNAIYAKTYRTTSGTFETDADSEFTLPYNMQSAAPWTELATVNVSAGGNAASGEWTGLTPGEEYEWYAAVSDGVTSVGTAVRSFTAVEPPSLPTVTIAATDDTAAEFGTDQALEFSVTRSGSTAVDLTIPLVAEGSASVSDYSGFTSSILIPANQASATMPLTVLTDADAEGTETVTIALGASADFTAGSPASAAATIADKPAQSFYFLNIADADKRAPGADADGDSNANIVEYFMGSLPADRNSKGVLEIPSIGTNTFKVRYPRAKNLADVTGSLLWSADLTNWHASGQSNGTHTVTFAEAVVSASEENPETVEATATITGPGEAPQIFIRLGVQ